MPARRRDPVSVPRTFITPSRHHHDYGIDESISRAGFFSNAVLEDTDAAAARSRGKDYDLLRSTQSAIIDTEMHSSPRVAAASRRARASSVPPKVQARPMRLQQQLNSRPKVVGGPVEVAPTIIYVATPSLAVKPPRPISKPVAQSNEVPWRLRANSVSGSDPRLSRAGSVPARPLSSHFDGYEPEPLPPMGTEGLRAHRPPSVLRSRAMSVQPGASRAVRAVSVPPERAMDSPIGRPRVGTEGLRAHRPPPMNRLNRAQSVIGLNRRPMYDLEDEIEKFTATKPAYSPRKPLEKKSAPVRRRINVRAASEPPCFIPPSLSYPLVGDVDKRPVVRSLYARRGQGGRIQPNPTYLSQSSIFGDQPITSGGLHSSRAPLPKPTDRKAIRSVDGFTKPKNVMSWEYRLESRLSPDDLIHTPSSFGRMRDQVRNAQEKMDRHRQLLDRYLDVDTKPSASYGTTNNAPSTSAGGDPQNAPMSDLRRRLRRTLAKTKNNPN